MEPPGWPMGHRALLALDRANGRYDLRESQWGARTSRFPIRGRPNPSLRTSPASGSSSAISIPGATRRCSSSASRSGATASARSDGALIPRSGSGRRRRPRGRRRVPDLISGDQGDPQRVRRCGPARRTGRPVDTRVPPLSGAPRAGLRLRVGRAYSDDSCENSACSVSGVESARYSA